MKITEICSCLGTEMRGACFIEPQLFCRSYSILFLLCMHTEMILLVNCECCAGVKPLASDVTDVFFV